MPLPSAAIKYFEPQRFRKAGGWDLQRHRRMPDYRHAAFHHSATARVIDRHFKDAPTTGFMVRLADAASVYRR